MQIHGGHLIQLVKTSICQMSNLSMYQHIIEFGLSKIRGLKSSMGTRSSLYTK